MPILLHIQIPTLAFMLSYSRRRRAITHPVSACPVKLSGTPDHIYCGITGEQICNLTSIGLKLNRGQHISRTLCCSPHPKKCTVPPPQCQCQHLLTYQSRRNLVSSASHFIPLLAKSSLTVKSNSNIKSCFPSIYILSFVCWLNASGGDHLPRASAIVYSSFHWPPVLKLSNQEQNLQND